MSIQLLNEISNNYQTALCMHRELADVFWFIYMPGYALLNEYQLITESLEQRRIKRYTSSTFHEYLLDEIPESANVAEPLLKGVNRKKVPSEDTCNIIKECFYAHMNWEEKSLKKYQQISSELLQNGEVSIFNFVGEIIKDVKAELVYITDKIIELEAMNWDMPQIVGEQADYFERYSHLISKLFLSNRMKELHHWNSSLDSKTRWEESYV